MRKLGILRLHTVHSTHHPDLHPTSRSHLRKDLTQIYEENANEKKAIYKERIAQKENASFTRLVLTTSEGLTRHVRGSIKDSLS